MCSILCRAIKYHRALGVLFWIFATLHMMLYEIKWLKNGTFVTNAWGEVNSFVTVKLKVTKYLAYLAYISHDVLFFASSQ